MPDDVKPLLRLGPFGGLNTRAAQPYTALTDCVAASNADTHRFGGALSNVMGRTRLCTFGMLETGSGTGLVALARYDTSPQSTYYLACAYTAGPTQNNGIAAAYSPSTKTFSSLDGLKTVWSRAIQANGAVFLDNGQQVFLNSTGGLSVALWQYPVPSQAVQGYALSVTPNPGTGMAQATYSYAFVQQIELPAYDGTVNQQTTPLYLNAAGQPLFSIATNGAEEVIVSGTFSGVTADGYPYVTQIYRQSSNVAVWYLLTTQTTNNSFVDTLSDQAIEGNQQLTLDNDQPPTGVIDSSGFALNPIESFQDRTWVLARVQNAQTNNIPETQLWYSRVDLPWSFDASLQVLDVNDSNTMPQAGTFGSPALYGDTPAGLAKIGSNLMVFGTYSTSMVYGTDQSNYVVIPLFADIGLIAPLSVVKGNGLVLWLSAEGVFSYDGANLQYLSDEIYNQLQSYAPNVLRNAHGFYADLTYCLSLPDVGVTWEYYIPNKKWLPVPYAAQCAAFNAAAPNDSTPYNTTVLGGKFNQVAAGEPGTYFVDYWFDGPQLTSLTATAPAEYDLGGPITVEWTSPITDSGDPTLQKSFTRCAISAPYQKALATVSLQLDPGFSDAPPPWSYTFDLSQGPTTKIVAIGEGSGVGYSAQATISVVNATGPNQLGVVTPTGATIQIWSVTFGGTAKRPWTIPS
jgi:hypothetical protein